MREKHPAGQCRLGLLLLAYHHVGPLLPRALPSAASTMPPLETTTEHCRLLVDRSIQSNYYSPAGPPALAFPRRALCTACIIIAFAWKELAKACPALAAASFLTLHAMSFFFNFFPAGLLQQRGL